MPSPQIQKIPLRDLIILLIGYDELDKDEIYNKIRNNESGPFDYIQMRQLNALLQKMSSQNIITQEIRGNKYVFKLTFPGIIEYRVIRDK